MIMKRIHALIFAFVLTGCTQAQIPPAEEQVGGAILAAPQEFRSEVTVLGYGPSGTFTKLKEGTGHLICLADDPNTEGFSVACYHEDLDPYMARGRELREQGIGGQENLTMREAEVEAGTLPWPKTPATLYVLSGDESVYDHLTGTVENASLRYVIYVPYATAESTGLSTSPTPNAPWLMSAGSYRAHIMIVPGSNN